MFQIVDYYPAYRGEYIKTIERRDYEQADHIFLIGHALLSYLTDELGIPSDKITVLGQGVALDQYEQELQEPDDIKAIPGPRAIWVGVVEKGDRFLFEAAAKNLQQLGGSLVFVGPEAEWANALSNKFNNTYVFGSKPQNIIPAYLNNSDLGLMLYNQNRGNIYHGQNPLKLYEYAAAGLPIISTPHEEFKFLKPPVIEVKSPEDMPMALNRALKERVKWHRAALDFAGKCSWRSCFNRAEEKIIAHLHSRYG